MKKLKNIFNSNLTKNFSNNITKEFVTNKTKTQKKKNNPNQFTTLNITKYLAIIQITILNNLIVIQK